MRSIFFVIASFLLISVYANPETETHAATTEHHDEHQADSAKGEDPIEAIMNHVADANEYHIATIGHNHISVPLPVMLFASGKGFSFFWSSDFKDEHHHHVVKNGYTMNEQGKVVSTEGRERATLLNVFGSTPVFFDFSITKNSFTIILGFIILTLVFFSIKKSYVTRKNQAPKGIQSLFEPVIQYLIDDVLKPNLGAKYPKFLPYILSVFFFILIINLIGLVPFFPGSANASGNIAFTFSLALLSGLLINVNGTKDYWKHVFAMPGVPKVLLLILTPIELLGVFLKPIVLMLRLFGNITGGHIAVLSIASLIFILGKMGQSVGGAVAGGFMAVPILLFVNALELFVAFLQAYVFTLLTTIFLGMAMEDHSHAEHH